MSEPSEHQLFDVEEDDDNDAQIEFEILEIDEPRESNETQEVTVKVMFDESPDNHQSVVTMDVTSDIDLSDIVQANSQASTKVNYLSLSDKENESDTTYEQSKSNIVRAPSVESIRSSRSNSPALGENDYETSTNTVQLNNSSPIGNKSKKRSQSNILAIYPPPPEKGGIAINLNDYQCLGNDEFLNDVIIDFYLSYLTHEVLSPANRQRTHVFSSHFYTRFAKPYQNDDSSNYASEDERRHAGVQRWTKNVDIFDKDFIIVPVNENLHWYLVIICFPYLVVDNDNDDDDEVPAFENVNAILIKQRPCILVFDSLYSNKTAVVNKLRGYLTCEYLAKKGEKKLFSPSNLRLVRPKIPKQSNATDCGLYVLQYVENFFKVPIEDYTEPRIDLRDWFTEEIIDHKREDIANLIGKLATDFHKGESIELPSIEFQKKKCLVDYRIESDDNEEMTWITKKNHVAMPNYEDTKVFGKKKKSSKLRLFDSESSSDEESVPLHLKPSDDSTVQENKLPSLDTKSFFIRNKNSPLSVKTLFLGSQKTTPCYANSSNSPLMDEPPLKHKTSEQVNCGSPPYCLPSNTLKKGKKLYKAHNKTVDLEEASGSPVKRNRIFSTPATQQSRAQKIMKLALPSYAIPNVSDPFYSISISTDNRIAGPKLLGSFKIKKL
ncbi:sentrin-specific protease 7 isoform X2 [Copidosoma floridanum]|uniref:sentrin-specific protease 7 isoform X2 n=1 Tax=Copidosoma floridanum TaxID=29053 RepID=UPI0006C98ADC|nr:sentrin-specific protease 7 isoform X2 [Copidosoma floridanum]